MALLHTRRKVIAAAVGLSWSSSGPLLEHATVTVTTMAGRSVAYFSP